jgi:CheY-like chemotaxis protein
MSRILLVDDSPHAQRMGERILSDEGYEVVTVSNADSALIRLDDVDPDVVLADTVMPGRTGYEICQYLKMSPRHRYVRVILTAGVLEAFDEERARQVSADGTLKKPFEASALVAAVKPLAEAAAKDRAASVRGGSAAAAAKPEVKAEVPFVAVVDSEHVRAAVTVALDASLETMIDEITRRVLAAMRAGNTEPRGADQKLPDQKLPELKLPDLKLPDLKLPDLKLPEKIVEQKTVEQKTAEPRIPLPKIAEPAPSEPMLALPRPETPKPVVPASPATQAEPVRRVTPLRIRSGSILGLDITKPESPAPDPE